MGKAIAKKPDLLEQARVRLRAVNVDDVLGRLGIREQSAPARRIEAMGVENPRRALAWVRLAGVLVSLAPYKPRTIQRAIQFYIPDGKYQLQVFAMDDANDGTLVVYCEDVLQEATAAGLIDRQSGQPHRYQVFGTPHAIDIEQLDGKTENLPTYAGAMTGWNRKAIRIILPATPSREQTDAAELLCAMNSVRWRSPAESVL